MSDTEDMQVEKPMAPLDLEILSTIQAARQANGLRHYDYHRYRQYCTRRLRRIRTNKSIRFMFGKSKSFVQREMTVEDVTDVRHLLVPLVMAERAWSYAMELNGELNSNDDPKPRWRLHLIKRLAKATKWAQLLNTLCTATGDSRTALEAEGYAASMSGWLLYFKEEFAAALKQFNTAKSVYESLSQIGSTAQREIIVNELSTLKTWIQYCEYASGDDNLDAKKLLEMSSAGEMIADEVLRGKLEKVMAEAHKQADTEGTTIRWKDQDVPVRSEKLRMILLRASDHAAELQKAKTEVRQRSASVEDGSQQSSQENLFLRIFSDYDDILSGVREEEQRLNKQKSGAKLSQLLDELKDLKQYVKTEKLRRVIERNIMVADAFAKDLEEHKSSQLRSNAESTTAPQQAMKRPRGDDKKASRAPTPVDLIRLYDRVLQNFSDLAEMFDGNDARVESECDAMELQFRALRCYYAAETFALQRKWTEAIVLYNKASALLEESTGKLADVAQQNLVEESKARIVRADKMVRGGKCIALARSFLQRVEADKKDQRAIEAGLENVALESRDATDAEVDEKVRFLLDRLEDTDDGSRYGAGADLAIFPVPPEPTAVPCRPTLLDKTFMYLSVPDLQVRAGKKAKTSTTTKTSGGGGAAQQGESGWLSSAKGWFSK